MSIKKYVPRSIQDVHDRTAARNERIEQKLFSEDLPKSFEVVIYTSLSPETKTPTSDNDASNNQFNYYFCNARSKAGHHDHLEFPEVAKTRDEYEKFRNAHFQAIIKKSDPELTPKLGEVWLATHNGGNLVTLVSKQRKETIITKFNTASPGQTAHNSGTEPTQTNADYSAADLKGRRSEPTPREISEGIIQDSFPFFSVDPVTNRELLDFIAKGESIRGSYNSINRIWYPNGEGGIFKLNTWPKDDGTNLLIGGLTLEQSTIGSVMDIQSPYNSIRYPTTEPPAAIFATGRYQVIPATMKDHLLETGLTQADLYDKTNQDRFCLTLIYGTKRPALRDYLMGHSGVSLNEAQTNFAQEWSSVPTPDGTSYYGNEKAHHNNQETRNLLERVRKANLLMESTY